MTTKCELLFIQGGGKGAHDDWDSKLVASLRQGLGQGYEIRYPRLPHEDEPQYARWKHALDTELAALGDDAIVVAHSVGATALLKVLSEQPPLRRFGALFFLAAPFVGAGGWVTDDLQLPLDLGARLPKDVPTLFYHGLEDRVAPPSHVDLYARAVPQARVHRLPGRDHQLNNDLKEVAAAIVALQPAK